MTAPPVAALPLAGRGFSAGWTPSAIHAEGRPLPATRAPSPAGQRRFSAPLPHLPLRVNRGPRTVHRSRCSLKKAFAPHGGDDGLRPQLLTLAWAR